MAAPSYGVPLSSQELSALNNSPINTQNILNKLDDIPRNTPEEHRALESARNSLLHEEHVPFTTYGDTHLQRTNLRENLKSDENNSL
jgi:hypothetical protein